MCRRALPAACRAVSSRGLHLVGPAVKPPVQIPAFRVCAAHTLLLEGHGPGLSPATSEARGLSPSTPSLPPRSWPLPEVSRPPAHRRVPKENCPSRRPTTVSTCAVPVPATDWLRASVRQNRTSHGRTSGSHVHPHCLLYFVCHLRGTSPLCAPGYPDRGPAAEPRLFTLATLAWGEGPGSPRQEGGQREGQAPRGRAYSSHTDI